MRVCSILLLLFSVVNSQCVSSTRPTCSDGAKNNGETGIDCGGPCEPCSLTVFGGNVPIFTGASCILEATETDPDVTGQFTFSTTQKDTQYDPLEPPPQLMTISYTTNGMTQGDHKFHVHNLGNIWSPDGYTVEAHFVGTVQSGSRPSLEAQEVGLLNYDTPIQVIESGQAAGTFTDTQARLNEKNSIVGRSVIVHSPGENSLTRDAQCVIGITGISSGAEIPDTPIVTRAVCILKPTSVTTRPIRGFVDLKLNEKNKIEVRIYVAGLDASTSYKIFVNQFGDLSDTTGAKTGSIFTGSKFTPDPVLGRYRVGEIGNFNFWLNSSATGVAKAWLVDNLLALNGVNSILGRAITIQTAENAPVLADCVVGLDEGYGTEGKYWVPTVINDTYPVVMGAVANLQATAGNSANIQGYIYFSALPFNHPVTPGGAIRIRGWVTGLLPSTTYPIWVSNRGDLGDNPSSLGEGTLGGQFTSNHPAGTPVSLGTITTDANGYARFLISSLDIMLANYNSIVGRAILIGSPAVALGLVGIEREDFASNAYGPPTVNKASCLLQPTAKGVANFTTGYVTFTTTPTGVLVDWNITAAGTAYTWHVHRNGDIYDASSGLAVGPHFQGAITQRTTGGWCEAGMLNNDGVIPSSPPFTDNYISLNGKNSIVGRAVIVHNSDGTRAAQCVIGVVEYDSGYTVQAAQIPPSPDDNTADCLVVDCSGHGACLNGTCKCDKGWSGAICNVQEPGNSAARAFALSPLLSLFVGLFVARQM